MRYVRMAGVFRRGSGGCSGADFDVACERAMPFG